MKNKKVILLVVIYIAFISLGLPDGLLGVAWPSMRLTLGMPLESMGFISTTLMICSSFSSIASGWLLRRFGTGAITFASGLMTGAALLGYSVSPTFGVLMLMTLPLGFGQGAVDSCLNLYVARHYTARHMSWLHCFWGVGASVGPAVMTWAITARTWRTGYGTISIAQLVLSGILLASLVSGLWRGQGDASEQAQEGEAMKAGVLSGVPEQAVSALLYFLYAGTEFTVGIWMNSVLVEKRGVAVAAAGFAISAYYFAIMAGRLLTGFIVNRIGNKHMIELGILVAAAGVVCVWVAGTSVPLIFAGTLMIGIGFAPVYPCLMHETPERFTPSVCTRLIGIQVGTAQLGSALIVPTVGMILSGVSLELLFPMVLGLLLLTLCGNRFLLYRIKQCTKA